MVIIKWSKLTDTSISTTTKIWDCSDGLNEIWIDHNISIRPNGQKIVVIGPPLALVSD
jgi:hypothetical protein